MMKGDSMKKVVMLLLLCAVVILAACTQSGESEETEDSALAGNAVNKGANLCNAKNEGKVLKDCPNSQDLKMVCTKGKLESSKCPSQAPAAPAQPAPQPQPTPASSAPAAAQPAAAAPSQPISFLESCGTPQSGWVSGTRYLLRNTVMGNSDECFNLDFVENVFIDCQRHSIQGSGTGVGVKVRGGDGNKVSNCVISNFITGIDAVSTSQITLELNSISTSISHGISLSQVSGGRIESNTLSRNGRHGMLLSGSSNLQVNRNTIEGNSWPGISFSGSPSNIVTSNRACGNYLGDQLTDLQIDVSSVGNSGQGNRFGVVNSAFARTSGYENNWPLAADYTVC